MYDETDLAQMLSYARAELRGYRDAVASGIMPDTAAMHAGSLANRARDVWTIARALGYSPDVLTTLGNAAFGFRTVTDPVRAGGPLADALSNFGAWLAGRADRNAGRRLDMWEADSGDLMSTLGETAPTTECNHPPRLAMCDAYESGWAGE